jgi:hypothetical protein
MTINGGQLPYIKQTKGLIIIQVLLNLNTISEWFWLLLAYLNNSFNI